jgi:hypothetical protein
MEFAAPGVVIRLGLDHAGGIGNHRRGLQLIGEVIEHSACAGGAVAAGCTLAIEKHVFGLQRSGEITLGHHPGRHVPVERAVGGQVSV